MNLENLRTKLIGAARGTLSPDDVPYGFEKRLMARLNRQLSESGTEDAWSLWAKGLWKGAAACAAITATSIVLSIWALPASSDAPEETPFEVVVLAGADQLTESW